MSLNTSLMLTTAIKLASDVHLPQVDKQGQPYILHPLRVMLRLKDPEQRIVAVLHDVLEDGDSVDRERVVAFLARRDPGLLHTLQAVSKDEFGKESYKDYIRRVLAAGVPARMVKLADLVDNSDPTRSRDHDIMGMILDRYVWASALLATGDEDFAVERKKWASIPYRAFGVHPGRFVLGPEELR